MQIHGVPGTRVTRFDHHLEPALRLALKRHLRHGEQGVEEDQKEQQGNVHAARAAFGTGSVAESVDAIYLRSGLSIPCRALRNPRMGRGRASMHYLIGDVQGCCDALDRLLAEIGFSPSRDCP